MELKKGTILQGGKYKIEKKLGQGSFGITYLATAKVTTDSGLGKMDVVAKVCIKEFFMSDVNSRKEDGSTIEGSTGSVFTNYRRKFRKEAENLAKLSHSNIVRVFDVFDENETSYYVMEFLDGENLDDYIKSRGRLPEDEAIKIIKEVGGALSYMHSKKMLHLDLKPKNVMITSDGQVHLIDFGLSKQYTQNGEPESSTTIGLGTPGYAPLEQSQYKQDGIFPATLDVYALGATLFKMLTGQRPPEATIILNDGFPSDILKRAGVSTPLIGTINKSMSPGKKSRYQCIDNFLDAIPSTEDVDEKTRIGQVDNRIVPKRLNLSLVDSISKIEIQLSNSDNNFKAYYILTPQTLKFNETFRGIDKSRYKSFISNLISSFSNKVIEEKDEGSQYSSKSISFRFYVDGIFYCKLWLKENEYERYGNLQFSYQNLSNLIIDNFNNLITSPIQQNPHLNPNNIVDNQSSKTKSAPPSKQSTLNNTGIAVSYIILLIIFFSALCVNTTDENSTIGDYILMFIGLGICSAVVWPLYFGIIALVAEKVFKIKKP